MTLCVDCDLLHRDSAKGNPWTWMCMAFPQDGVDPVSGEVLPPYHRCRDVRQVTVFKGKCRFFEEADPKQMELS